MRPPIPPRGVRLRMVDGTTRPVEVAYIGRRWRTHHWQITALADAAEVRGLEVDVLPARTAVTLALVGEWEGER